MTSWHTRSTGTADHQGEENTLLDILLSPSLHLSFTQAFVSGGEHCGLSQVRVAGEQGYRGRRRLLKIVCPHTALIGEDMIRGRECIGVRD
jgi:hypothetical protein